MLSSSTFSLKYFGGGLTPACKILPEAVKVRRVSQLQMANNDHNYGRDDTFHVPLPLEKLRTSNRTMADKRPVVLVSSGSFNPPTILHLRIFELARDELTADGYDVLGGYMSPVNDAYGKKGLVAGQHRVAMCQLAAATSDFIMVDSWEVSQSSFQRTIKELQRVAQQVNAARSASEVPVRSMLLCGADLLESFSKPGVWIEDQLRQIFTEHGVVCISRAGSDTRKHIEESDLLYEHRKHIRVVDEWVSNNVSSTIVRRLLRRGRSVKYLVPDPVIDYIEKHGLYMDSVDEKTRDWKEEKGALE